MASILKLSWMLIVVVSSITAAPVSDPHLMGNRYFPVAFHQPPAYYYTPLQQRWSFLPSSLNTRFLLPSPCIPCGTGTVMVNDEQGTPLVTKFSLTTGASTAAGSPTAGGTAFDFTNSWLTNPLGIFFPNGQQHPAVWPWVKPCCVIPPTTTVPPTSTTTKAPTTTTSATTTTPVTTTTTTPATTTTTTTTAATTTTTTAAPSSTTTTQGTTVSTTTSTTAAPTTTSTIAPIGRSLIGDAVPKENADSISASGFKLLMNLYPPSSISIV